MRRLATSILLGLIFSSVSFMTTPGFSPDTQEEPLSIEFTTFFGDYNNQDGYAMTLDPDGNIYVVGSTLDGYRSALLVKFDPDGNILFSKTISGSNHDTATDIALDSEGRIIIVGVTKSSDFPTTNNAFNNTYGGPGTYPDDWGCCGDGFLTILAKDAETILYSTYIGGSETDSDLAVEVDTLDNIYIAGITKSPDFPTTSNAINSSLNGGADIFISIFSPNASSLLYSSFLGGSGDEITRYGIDGKWLILDKSNNIIITGLTESTDYPTSTTAFDASHNGGIDTFLTKLSSDDSSILYSSFIGGDGVDASYGVSVDNDNNFIIAGSTSSSNFPTTENAIQSNLTSTGSGCFGSKFTFGGKILNILCGDIFVSKFSKKGELLSSTYLGGENFDGISGVAVDKFNSIYIAGFSQSQNLPTTPSAYQREGKGLNEMYFAKVDKNLTSILYATYISTNSGELLNDIAINNQGDVYVTGFSTDFSFPEINSPDIYSGGWDMTLIKFSNSISYTSFSTSSNILSTSLSSPEFSKSNTSSVTSAGFSLLVMLGGLVITNIVLKRR